MNDIASGNSEILGDSALQSTVLESNASAVNYHRWLCSLAWPYLGDDPLELGSGTGEYAETWLQWGLPQVTITEVDLSRAESLRLRFADDARVRFGAIDLDSQVPGEYSSVVSFNVLEHIPDDVAALRAATAAVRPGGAVISFVPAFPFAMSDFDRSIGHVRRYTIESMAGAYSSAGLEVEILRYVNAPGLLAWYLGMRVMKMVPGDGPVLKIWDKFVVPAARRWEVRRRVPFGQSVFCVGRTPA